MINMFESVISMRFILFFHFAGILKSFFDVLDQLFVCLHFILLMGRCPVVGVVSPPIDYLRPTVSIPS